MLGRLSNSLRQAIGGSTAFQANVRRVASGAALSQVIGLLAIPLLSRLFMPVDFALLAYFTAAYALAIAATTLRFEWLVPNAPQSTQAATLIVLSCLSSIVVTVIICFGLWKAGGWIAPSLGFDLTTWPFWVLLFAVAVLFGSLRMVLHAWLVYLGDLKFFAVSLVVQVAVNLGCSLVGGVVLYPPGGGGGIVLVVSYVLGVVAGCLTMYLGQRTSFTPLWDVTLRQLRQMLRDKIRLTQTSLLVSVMNAGTVNMQMFFIGALFGEFVLGIYALVYRIAFSPVAFVTSSVSNSFWAEAARLAKEDYAALRQFYTATLTRLTGLAGIWVSGICMFSSVLEPILGSDWQGATWMLLAFSPLIFTTLIFGPTNHLVVYEKQIYQLFTDGLGLICAVGVLWLGAVLAWSPTLTIFAASAIVSVGYVMRGLLHFHANRIAI